MLVAKPLHGLVVRIVAGERLLGLEEAQHADLLILGLLARVSAEKRVARARHDCAPVADCALQIRATPMFRIKLLAALNQICRRIIKRWAIS